MSAVACLTHNVLNCGVCQPAEFVPRAFSEPRAPGASEPSEAAIRAAAEKMGYETEGWLTMLRMGLRAAYAVDRAASSDDQALRVLLAEAGCLVTLLAHGTTWEIAPSIQAEARAVEAKILAALAGAAPSAPPQ